jgi:cytochrome c553
MLKKLFFIWISSAALLLATPVQSDVEIANGQKKSASCAGCHGDDGNSMVSTFPKLAGQHKGYLVKQLNAFKSGDRVAPMMAPLAMGLDDASIHEIASYYAAQKVKPNPAPVLFSDDDEDESFDADKELKELLAVGKDLYRNGNLKSEVSACIACHGPFGEGNKPANFPALHAQHADYLIKTLTDYKNNIRSNNPDNMMHMIARKMTNKEIKAVAYYLSTMK